MAVLGLSWVCLGPVSRVSWAAFGVLGAGCALQVPGSGLQSLLQWRFGAALRFQLQAAPGYGCLGPSQASLGVSCGALGTRCGLQVAGSGLQSCIRGALAQHCASNCKLNLAMAILGLSRASLLRSSWWSLRPAGAGSGLQSFASDALCTELRFQLQAARPALHKTLCFERLGFLGWGGLGLVCLVLGGWVEGGC